jgi:hypothetical protein
MSSSFAASTCRTTLAPFRQGISLTPRLYVMTRRIKHSKNVGAVGFEPTNPSLVRRNEVRIGPAFPGQFMHLNCGNHALRCSKVPGIVCTVVPASGSRSRTEIPIARHRKERPATANVDPSLEKRVGAGGRLLESHPAGWLGFPS